MNSKKLVMVFLALILIAVLAACGGTDENVQQSDATTETVQQTENQSNENAKEETEDSFVDTPATITVLSLGAGLSNETDVEKVLLGPVHTKYPNINIELIEGTTVNVLEELIATGQIPDMIATSNFNLDRLIDLEVPLDLNPAVEKYNIDMSNVVPELMNAIKAYGLNGELYGIPFSMNYGIMAYNKEIFDRFGVEYPIDGMTWDEVSELARKMTRMDGNEQFYGITLERPQVFSRALSLPVVDESGTKGALQTEGYNQVFSVLNSLHTIPGMDAAEAHVNGFLVNQNVAMMPYWIAAMAVKVMPMEQDGTNFDWDLVSFPFFPERPNIGREVDFHMLMATPAGAEKEAVYRTMEAMQTEEAQRLMNRGGRLTVWDNDAIREEFAVDLNLFEGKNVSGIFSVEPAALPKTSMYDSRGYTFLNEAIQEVVNGTDINTALRTADEKLNQYIAEQLKN